MSVAIRRTSTPAALAVKTGSAYVLVTPAYNEENFIGKMIESIASQTVQPLCWVIADDGSTDRTPEIVRCYAQRYPFIELVSLPKHSGRAPGGEAAIRTAIGLAQAYDYEFLARFDADLEFECNYVANIMAEFSADRKLGIAGGGLYVVDSDGRLELERVPKYHVRGALKMYRRECLEEIGSLRTCMGWDTIDEVFAWELGWKTRSFFQYRVIHKRPTGQALPPRAIARRRGHGEYYTWSHPLFVLVKSLSVAASSPSAAWQYLAGFVECYRKHEPRLQDRGFRHVRRRQQLRRLFSLGILSQPKISP